MAAGNQGSDEKLRWKTRAVPRHLFAGAAHVKYEARGNAPETSMGEFKRLNLCGDEKKTPKKLEEDCNINRCPKIKQSVPSL